MQAFTTTLNQMLTLCCLVGIGVLLRKKNVVPKTAAGTLARLETWLFIPGLTIGNLMEKCTPEKLGSSYLIVLLGAGVLAITALVSGPVSRLFSPGGFERRVYRYSLVIPNYGYLGLALVRELLGSDYLFLYSMFNLPFTLFVYTFGIRWLDPQNETRCSPKSLLTPAFFALPVGMLLGLTGAPVPLFLKKCLDTTANCMAPVAMLIMGLTIGDFNLRSLLENKRVYLLSVLRLLLLPAAVCLALRGIHMRVDFVVIATVFAALPLGLNAIVFPAAKGGDVRLGASMALVSNTLAILTFPLVFTALV